MPKRLLAFDVLTVPDVDSIRRLHRLPDQLSGDEVAEFALQRCRVSTGKDQLPCHLQRVVCIGGVEYCDGEISHYSFSGAEMAEPLLLQAFFDRVGSGAVLWSWQGGKALLPVLVARGVAAGAFTAANAFGLHRDLAVALSLEGVPLADYAEIAGVNEAAESDPQVIWHEFQAGNLSLLRETVSSRASAVFTLGLRLATTCGEVDMEASREVLFKLETLRV